MDEHRGLEFFTRQDHIKIQTIEKRCMKTAMIKPEPALARRFLQNKLAYPPGLGEINHQLEQGAHLNLIDVREPGDLGKGHFPGAHSLPHAQWTNTSMLRKDEVNNCLLLLFYLSFRRPSGSGLCGKTISCHGNGPRQRSLGKE